MPKRTYWFSFVLLVFPPYFQSEYLRLHAEFHYVEYTSCHLSTDVHKCMMYMDKWFWAFLRVLVVPRFLLTSEDRVHDMFEV